MHNKNHKHLIKPEEEKAKKRKLNMHKRYFSAFKILSTSFLPKPLPNAMQVRHQVLSLSRHHPRNTTERKYSCP